MGEHLKNFGVGAVVATLILATGIVLGWLAMNYKIQLGIALAIAALCIPIYGLGYSLRQKWKRPTPEGER